MVLRAFKEWKRMEYQMVLEGLKKYSAQLEKKNAGANMKELFRGKSSRY